MKWFQRKSQRQPTKNEPRAQTTLPEAQSPTARSTFQELFLLLLRPSVPKIFESAPDTSLMDAAAIMTSFGVHRVQGMNKHQIEGVPVLLVTESGKAGHVFSMRLELQVLLHQLATRANPPIDYPHGLFTNCDVIMVGDYFYSVRLFRSEVDIAHPIFQTGTELFTAPHIGYMGTTTDEATLTSLRRLEANAKEFLPSEVSYSDTSLTLRQLPPQIYDFLKPIFKRAGEVIRKA